MAEYAKNPAAIEEAKAMASANANKYEVKASPLGDVAKQAKDVASHVTTQAKELVSAEVTAQRARSAGDLGDIVHALRQTSHQLGENIASPYVEMAADQVEKASRFLRTADLNQVVGSVERFARREPLLFLGGAFALGLLGARFLKSSERHEPGGEATTAADMAPTRTVYNAPSSTTLQGGVRAPSIAMPGDARPYGGTGRI
jgi:hypothetical protein